MVIIYPIYSLSPPVSLLRVLRAHSVLTRQKAGTEGTEHTERETLWVRIEISGNPLLSTNSSVSSVYSVRGLYLKCLCLSPIPKKRSHAKKTPPCLYCNCSIRIRQHYPPKDLWRQHGPPKRKTHSHLGLGITLRKDHRAFQPTNKNHYRR